MNEQPRHTYELYDIAYQGYEYSVNLTYERITNFDGDLIGVGDIKAEATYEQRPGGDLQPLQEPPTEIAELAIKEFRATWRKRLGSH